MGAAVPLKTRLWAWWEGVELPPAAAPDEAAPPARDAADAGSGDVAAAAANPVHGLRARLLAWWEGYELPNIAAEADGESGGASYRSAARGPAKEAVEAPPEPAPPREVWTTARIRIAERLWGAGFVTPGGVDHIMTLIKPAGLNPKMSFADLSAGLGGAARAVAEAFGIWVTAMEANDLLANHGMEQSTMAGMAKKAPVIAYDPESVELKPHGFDCIFSKEAFFTVVNKRHLYAAVAKALKKGGHFLYTDYMLAKSDKLQEETQNWAAHEPVRPELWSVRQVREYLEKQGLDIRIEDDVSLEMCKLILLGWREALKNFKPGHFDAPLRQALMAEAELWARRYAVLQGSDVRLYRIHALKKG